MIKALTIAQYIEQAIAALQPFQKLRIPRWMRQAKPRKPRIPNAAVQAAAQEKRDRRASRRYQEQLARTMGQFNAKARVAERQQVSSKNAAGKARDLLDDQAYRNSGKDAAYAAAMDHPGGLQRLFNHSIGRGPKKGRYPNALRISGQRFVDYGF